MKRKNIDYSNWSKDELIKELKRIKETTYGLVWHKDVSQEKIDVLINSDARTPEEMFANEVGGKPFPVLKEVKDKEIVSNKDDQTHVLIEGDNYHSLAVLNFTHQEAIDVIYIDPPYNTGNKDFIYTDKYKSDYVIKDDPFRHSKWLTFMEKRLKLAHKLLKDTGIIFISIDDNEFAPLRMLCDEIFEESNFVATFKWNRTAKAPSLSNSVRTKYEYILCYKKKKNVFLYGKDSYNMQGPLWHLPNRHSLLIFPARSIKIKQTFKKGNYGGTYKVELLDDMVESSGYNKNDVRIKAHSAWGQAKINNYVKDGFAFEIKKSPTTLYTTLSNEGNYIAPSDLITYEECGVKKNTDATKELNEMGISFDYSKPVSLIEYLIKAATYTNKSGSVLDFMAGSGTTGHAVLNLNKEDGGNRKFILCTNNENNIATEVCQPRLQKVMKGYKNSKGEEIKGLGGNLKYYTAYDFVESDQSDKNKHKLVNKCAEMLCIKEGIYDLITGTDDYKILKSHDNRYLGIIFYEDAIDEYKKAIKKIDAPINTYVFSLGDDPHTTQFADVKHKVILQAIPEIILKVYQEIFR
jgi:adenine-specific DNA-methyltransferase